MSNYIKQEDVVSIIEEGLNNPNVEESYGYDAIDILGKVQFMPAADVRENVHGEWEWDKHQGVFLCPFCKEEMHDDLRRDGSFAMAEFCWHCGADMKGEADE